MPLKYSPEGQITGCRAESVPDAKLCIRELKLKKKELLSQRHELASVDANAAVDATVAQFDKAILGLERYILSHPVKPGGVEPNLPSVPSSASDQAERQQPVSELPGQSPRQSSEAPNNPKQRSTAPSTTTKTYYEILDVSMAASATEIKDSYRLHAAAWHPDKHAGVNKERAEAKMRELNDAYRVLGNLQSRAEYDKSLGRIRKTTFPQKSAHVVSADVVRVYMVQVPGTTAQLPIDVYNRVMRCLSRGQMAMASQELQNSMPGMPVAKTNEIITRLSGGR